MDWLRFYTDVLDDRRLHTMPAELYRRWTMLLCLTRRNGGCLPVLEDTAFALRITDEEARDTLHTLTDMELLDCDQDGTYTPHNWCGRQYDSDSSTERVRRHRAAKSAAVTETVTPVTDETLPKRFSNGAEQNRVRADTEQSRADTDARAPAREVGAVAPKQPHYSATFEAFWRQYPRREKKPGAWAAWLKIAPPRGPTGDMADTILAGVATWALSEQWQRGIYPHATTWLNGRQWEDEPAMATGKATRGPRGTQDILDEAFGRGAYAASDDDPQHSGPVYDVALSGENGAGHTGAVRHLPDGALRPD
jgi:hypothetical protein